MPNYESKSVIRCRSSAWAPLAILILLPRACFAQESGSRVTIVPQAGGYVLQRGGQPFFIKGAGGALHRLDSVVAAGGNSIRLWSEDDTTLHLAGRQGLAVLLGLALGISRHGFDYHDASAVQNQLEKTVAAVHRLKSNPAILMWALGNELELAATDEQRVATWKAVEQLARAVKEEDPAHPVVAVLAGPGKNKLRELDRYCTSLDAVGINTYGGIMTLSDTITAQDFHRPYIVTEFGPRGHWEVAKTAWGMPIEDTSTQKADFILHGYDRAIAHKPQCLGSYVFLWGQKQEKTHTWYGLFLPGGAHLGGVDVMQYLWTGKWPAHRAPVLEGGISVTPEKQADQPTSGVFLPGSRLLCSIEAKDLDGDPMTVKWDVRPDVANNRSDGGDFEPATSPIPGVILQQTGHSALIQAPKGPADYRIFVYVYNQFNGAATANVSIRVR